MNEIEQKLWASVYASEFDRLQVFSRGHEKDKGYTEFPWERPAKKIGDSVAAMARERADEAVKEFRARADK
jgi:hypothetical protein